MNLIKLVRLKPLPRAQNITVSACIVLLLLIRSTTASAETKATQELSLGSVAMDIPAVMHQRLKPLADYLSHELGRSIRLHMSADLSKAVKDVADGTWTSPT